MKYNSMNAGQKERIPAEYQSSSENNVKPLYYKELDRYASPIKDRLLKISSVLQEGIVAFGNDESIKAKKKIESLANSLIELDIKSIYTKSKTFWETQKYAESKIQDKTDVDDLFSLKKIKELVENVDETSMKGNIDMVKKMIDEKAKNIRIADSHVLYKRKNLSTPIETKLKRIERESFNTPVRDFSYKPPNVRKRVPRSNFRDLLRRKDALNKKDVLKSPAGPLFPQHLTNIDVPAFRQIVLVKPEKVLGRMNLTRLQKYNQIVKDLEAKTKEQGSMQRSRSHKYIGKKNKAILHERTNSLCLPKVKPRRSETPYFSRATELMDRCDKWNDSYKIIKDECKNMYSCISEDIDRIKEECDGKDMLVVPPEVVSYSVSKFKREKSCFIYGKAGQGSFISEKRISPVRRSDSLAKLNLNLAKRFLKELDSDNPYNN